MPLHAPLTRAPVEYQIAAQPRRGIFVSDTTSCDQVFRRIDDSLILELLVSSIDVSAADVKTIDL